MTSPFQGVLDVCIRTPCTDISCPFCSYHYFFQVKPKATASVKPVSDQWSIICTTQLTKKTLQADWILTLSNLILTPFLGFALGFPLINGSHLLGEFFYYFSPTLISQRSSPQEVPSTARLGLQGRINCCAIYKNILKRESFKDVLFGEIF